MGRIRVYVRGMGTCARVVRARVRIVFVALAVFSGLGGGVAGVGPGAGSARAQWFELVGYPEGARGSRVFAVTPDGATAAGGVVDNPGAGFTWTRADGRNEFGRLPGMPASSYAYAIAADGMHVAGQTVTEAYRYRLGDPALELLGVQGGYDRSKGAGISGDGEVVVGYSEVGQVGDDIRQAFRWTRATGLVGLGFARPDDFTSDATAISRNAGTIVGHGRGGSGYNGAFAWTQATGMVPLPGLDATNDAQAFGVNFDGRLIVGEARTPSTRHAATMWIDGVPITLGTLPEFSYAQANAVSDDGGGVVGWGSGSRPQTALIWTPGRGMEVLADYLARYGVALPPGIHLISATAVGADGRTIAGYADVPGQRWQGFVASIPAPGTWALLAGGCLLARCRRRLP